MIFFRAAGQFKHHRVRRKINDLGFIDRSDFPHFGTLGGIAGHFQQQQFPLQALIRGQFKYLAGHFQPLGLQNQLADGGIVAMQGNGNAADRRVVGGGNRQAVNVEAAAAEQAGHARQKHRYGYPPAD